MMHSENPSTQGRRTPKAQLNFIGLLRREGYSVPAIREQMRAVFGAEARGERTVQNHVKAIDENRIPWDRLATDGDDAKLVFEVLAEVIRVSQSNKLVFTQEEAEWVLWIQKSAPDLPPYYVWLIACRYMNETRVKPEAAKDFSPYDAFLALKPWQSLEAMIAFDNGSQQGLIPDGHVMIGIAADARAYANRKDSEMELLKLEERAKAGDPDAKIRLSIFNRITKKVEAPLEQAEVDVKGENEAVE